MDDRKCSLVVTKANLLLERPPEPGYLEEWTELLGYERRSFFNHNQQSIILFRIGDEWLALKTIVFSAITEMRLIRRIPHRSSEILKGLVNFDGQLFLCFNLDKLLEISPSRDDEKNQQKLVAISQNLQSWVFVADEVLGLYTYDNEGLKNIPVTVSKSRINYLKGILNIRGKHVSLIDEGLLFYSLEKRIG